MEGWELVDIIEPADAPDLFPRVAIRSESQLREELARLRLRRPGVVGLNKTAGGGLQIGIGGPYAGIRWSVSRVSERGGVVLADQPYCQQRIDFAAEEDTIAFWPEQLIPVDLATEVIVFYFKNNRLPDWIAWNEWDPASSKWQVKPAVGARSA